MPRLATWTVLTVSFHAAISVAHRSWKCTGCLAGQSAKCGVACVFYDLETFCWSRSDRPDQCLVRGIYDPSTTNLTIDYFPPGDTWDLVSAVLGNDLGLEVSFTKTVTSEDGGLYYVGTETDRRRASFSVTV